MTRLKEIAKLLAPYTKIADCGCDHGYLLIESFKLSPNYKFVAIDNKIGPLNTCKENLKNNPNFNNIRFSLSSGIKDIDNDTEVVVLAGMGGMLIIDILKDDLKNVKRIITCANRDNANVRKYIYTLGYKITNERIVYENNKYYQIIVFDKDENNNAPNSVLKEEELLYGPINIKNNEKIFIDYLNSELGNYININNLHESDRINNRIKLIRSILNESK